MPVSGQGVAEAQLLHDDKTGAIGERIAVLGMFAEEGFCGFKTLFRNPDEPESLATVQDLQHPQGAVASDPRFSQGAGLVNDIIGQHEANAGFQQAADAALGRGG